MSRAPQTLPDVRRRCTKRLAELTFLKESTRAFGLGEIPKGTVHGSFFAVIADGRSLGTWKVTDANGFDWQSQLEITAAFALASHRSVEDHDTALGWGHKMVNQLVRQTPEWPIDLRCKGDDVTVNVQPDPGGQFLLVRVGLLVCHNLSIVEA